MRLFKFIFKLSRPRFWMYLAGPYLLGYTFGFNHNQSFLNPVFLYSLIFFLFPANIFLYGINDIYDMETDNINPKKKSKEQATKTTNSKIYQRSVFISLLLSIPLFILQNSLSNVFTIIFLLLSYYYSAPPLRFKKRPFIDSTSNILYGIPAFIGFTQIQPILPSINLIVIISLWTAAMHLFSAIPDIEYDKKAKIKTTAVYIGEKNSLFLCLFLWFSMATLSIFIAPVFVLSFIYPLCVILVLTNTVSLQNMYWKFPYITTILGFILYLYAYNT